MTPSTKQPIGSILLRQRAVSAKELEAALKRSKVSDSGTPLVSQLTREGIIRETQALKALSEQSGCPGIDLNQICIRLADVDELPQEMCEAHALLPVLVKGDRMFVAMANPADQQVISEIELITGKRLFPYISLKATLQRVIAEVFALKAAGRRHFVGPGCPPETVAKAGVSVLPPPLEAEPGEPRADTPTPEPSEDALRPARPPRAADRGAGEPAPSAVVVDDALAAAALDDESFALGEPTFGDPQLAIEEPASVPCVTQPSPTRPKEEATGPSVLVVDGDAGARTALVKLLAGRGYQTRVAECGDTALQLIREQPPDVIVLEALLPRVHGFEVAKQLKSSERYAHIPIVMVSGVYRGWRFAHDVKSSYGVDAFVEKPFASREIVEAIERARQAPGHEPPVEVSPAGEPYLAAGIDAYRAGRMDEAVDQLRRGTQADPLAYKIRFHLGLLYGKQGRIYDAIQELEAALSVRWDFFPALKNLAVLYQNAGFRNKAIEMWERSLAVAPDEPTRDEIKRHLMAVL